MTRRPTHIVMPAVELPPGYTPPSASMNPDAAVTPLPQPEPDDWKLHRCVHCGEIDCVCPEPDGSPEGGPR